MFEVYILQNLQFFVRAIQCNVFHNDNMDQVHVRFYLSLMVSISYKQNKYKLWYDQNAFH